jgi:beta-lactamase class A
MPRLEKARRPKASLHRRALLAAAAGGLAAACGDRPPLAASRGPPLDIARLNKDFAQLAAGAAPAVVGFGMMDLSSGEVFLLAGERRFPLLGLAALPLGAAVMAEGELGRLPLAEPMVVQEQQLSPPPSEIATAWPARRDYTADDLLRAALQQSDTTAFDVLIRRIGGPGAVTAWLHAHRLTDIRLDRYARELAPEANGLASFRPQWRTPAGFATGRAAVSAEDRRRALAKWLVDPRDTTTPRGMLDFLQMLDRAELVSAASAQRLLRMMARLPGSGGFGAGLAENVALASVDCAAFAGVAPVPFGAEAGIFTLPDRRRFAFAAFLRGASDGAGLADIARAAARGTG